MRALIVFLSLLVLPAKTHAEFVEFVVTSVDMFVGESKIFQESFVKRVAIGRGDLVNARELDEDQLMIMAEKPGSTTVHIWYDNPDWRPRVYNIRISETDPQTRVRSEDMIRFNVKLVEFRKSVLKELGIDWSKGINGPSGAFAARYGNSNLISAPLGDDFVGLPGTIGGINASVGWASAITSRINFLASNGHASTIAEPILMCLNGGEADFHAGGELPLPVRNADGEVSVQFKPYGIRLSVKPRVNAEGLVDTIITTEVSEIDNSVAVENIPGLITRNTTTRVQVASGETIILAGLLSERVSQDNSSIPGLGNIPAVGNAFSNNNGSRQTTELVMFLQPQVISPQRADRSLSDDTLPQSSELQLSEWSNKVKINLVD